MIQVVLVDDHSMVREGLKRLVELEDDILVVGEAGDGQEGIRIALEMKPDIILMDINMPLMNGLEAVAELRKMESNARIIMLTLHNEVEYLYETLEIGANQNFRSCIF